MAEKVADKSFRLRCCDRAHMELEVARPVSALELLRELTCSRQMSARVLARGRLSLDGAGLAPASRLAPGDVVGLAFAHTHVPGPASEAEPVVVWRDRFALAVDKPAGILVHADGGVGETLTARVQGLLDREGRPDHEGRPDGQGPPGRMPDGGRDSVARLVPQALQRLDVETSGLVLFSLAEETQPAFDALMAGRVTEKRYLAVVRGPWPSGTMLIDRPIGRDRHDARRMCVSAGGKSSRTWARPLATRGGHTLLLVRIGTGRRHQIRVHLASTGHPIVGDRLYGALPAGCGGRAGCGDRAGRGGHGSRATGGLMLHAIEERLAHPVTGEELVLRTAWPKRFDAFFSAADASGWSILEQGE